MTSFLVKSKLISFNYVNLSIEIDYSSIRKIKNILIEIGGQHMK